MVIWLNLGLMEKQFGKFNNKTILMGNGVQPQLESIHYLHVFVEFSLNNTNPDIILTSRRFQKS